MKHLELLFLIILLLLSLDLHRLNAADIPEADARAVVGSECLSLLNPWEREISQIFFSARKEGRSEAYLPQAALREDIEELSQTVSRIEDQILLIVSDEQDGAKEWNRGIRDYFAYFRRSLDQLRTHASGIAYSRWVAFAESYLELLHREELYQRQEAYSLKGSWLDFRDRLVRALSEANLEKKWFEREGLSARADWFYLPTFREIDIPTMNRWMGNGFVPFGLTRNEEVFVDGFRFSRRGYILHDIAHFKQLPRQANNSREYYNRYFMWLQRFDNKRLKATVETLWFFVNHELDNSQFNYGPQLLSKMLNNLNHSHLFRRRLNIENDLWTFDFLVPDLALINQAKDALLNFAESGDLK